MLHAEVKKLNLYRMEQRRSLRLLGIDLDAVIRHIKQQLEKVQAEIESGGLSTNQSRRLGRLHDREDQ